MNERNLRTPRTLDEAKFETNSTVVDEVDQITEMGHRVLEALCVVGVIAILVLLTYGVM